MTTISYSGPTSNFSFTDLDTDFNASQTSFPDNTAFTSDVNNIAADMDTMEGVQINDLQTSLPQISQQLFEGIPLNMDLGDMSSKLVASNTLAFIGSEGGGGPRIGWVKPVVEIIGTVGSAVGGAAQWTKEKAADATQWMFNPSSISAEEEQQAIENANTQTTPQVEAGRQLPKEEQFGPEAANDIVKFNRTEKPATPGFVTHNDLNKTVTQTEEGPGGSRCTLTIKGSEGSNNTDEKHVDVTASYNPGAYRQGASGIELNSSFNLHSIAANEKPPSYQVDQMITGTEFYPGANIGAEFKSPSTASVTANQDPTGDMTQLNIKQGTSTNQSQSENLVVTTRHANPLGANISATCYVDIGQPITVVEEASFDSDAK
jgi:hypothetical protein